MAPVGVPYWFLPDEGGAMTPATYEEMADTSDVYLKVQWQSVARVHCIMAPML